MSDLQEALELLVKDTTIAQMTVAALVQRLVKNGALRRHDGHRLLSTMKRFIERDDPLKASLYNSRIATVMSYPPRRTLKS